MDELSSADSQMSLREGREETKAEDGSTSTTVVCTMCSSPATVWAILSANASKQNHQREGSTFTKSVHSEKARSSKEPLCLLHYYTTDACRRESANAEEVTTVVNSTELQKQLPKQQEIFAEAFLQIQREIQDAIMRFSSTNEASRAAISHNHDPLSIIANLNQHSHKKRKRQVSFKKKLSRQQPLEGGFLRDIPIPERLKQVQQQQAHQQQELIARMSQSSIPTERNLTKRREPSRASVWQVLSNNDRKPESLPTLEKSKMELIADDMPTDHIACTCGSQQVQVISSSSNRNQNMSKAETWGSKDRHDEIVSRYLCAQCGKTWSDVV